MIPDSILWYEQINDKQNCIHTTFKMYFSKLVGFVRFWGLHFYFGIYNTHQELYLTHTNVDVVSYLFEYTGISHWDATPHLVPLLYVFS